MKRTINYKWYEDIVFLEGEALKEYLDKTIVLYKKERKKYDQKYLKDSDFILPCHKEYEFLLKAISLVPIMRKKKRSRAELEKIKNMYTDQMFSDLQKCRYGTGSKEYYIIVRKLLHMIPWPGKYCMEYYDVEPKDQLFDSEGNIY